MLFRPRSTGVALLAVICGWSAPPAKAQPCTIATFAGGDSALLPDLLFPRSIVEGPDGSLYIAEPMRVRKVRPDYTVETLFEVAPGARQIVEVAVDQSGALYVSAGPSVQKITPDGSQSSFIGDPRNSPRSCELLRCRLGDPASNLGLSGVDALDIDSVGNVHAVVRRSSSDRQLIMVDPQGRIARLGPATESRRVLMDGADRAHLSGPTWTVVAPDGSQTTDAERSALAAGATDYALMPGGDVFFIGFLGGIHSAGRLRGGLIYDRIAGDLEAGYAGDGGAAGQARFDTPRRLRLGRDGSLYVLDHGNHAVRRIVAPDQCPSGGARPLATPGGLPGILSPGGVFSVFGWRLGPPTPVVAAVNESGRLPTTLVGTRVWIDGTAAPLLFVSDRQINAVAPFGVLPSHDWVEGRLQYADRPGPRIVIESPSGASDPLQRASARVFPQIFTLDGSNQGPAAALNQDGTLNADGNPAERGEVVVFWATGLGAMTPQPRDGAILSAPLPSPTLPVGASLGREPMDILYAGAAPGMVAGVIQVNARIPPSQGFGDEPERLSLQIETGGALSSQGVRVFVAP